MDDLTRALQDVDPLPEHVWLRSIAHAMDAEPVDDRANDIADLVPWEENGAGARDGSDLTAVDPGHIGELPDTERDNDAPTGDDPSDVPYDHVLSRDEPHIDDGDDTGLDWAYTPDPDSPDLLS